MGSNNITRSVPTLNPPIRTETVLVSKHFPGTEKSQYFSIGRHMKRKAKAANKEYPHTTNRTTYVTIFKRRSDVNRKYRVKIDDLTNSFPIPYNKGPMVPPIWEEA